jgi:hypothetical protein
MILVPVIVLPVLVVVHQPYFHRFFITVFQYSLLACAQFQRIAKTSYSIGYSTSTSTSTT